MSEGFWVNGEHFSALAVEGLEQFVVLFYSEHVSVVDHCDVGVRGKHVEEVDERVYIQSEVFLIFSIFFPSRESVV